MRRARWIATVVLAVLVVIVVLQNTETVETRLLFATVSMPRAVLLLTTVLIGFFMGVLTALLLMRQRERPRVGGDDA